MTETGRRTRYTTVSIPVTLYERIKRLIEGTGFTRVSRFVTYVLREVVAEMEEELRSSGVSEEEKREIIESFTVSSTRSGFSGGS